MHAHRVDVFDRADDHDVVRAIAHQFQLELFPAVQTLLDQYLTNARGCESAPRDRLEFFHRSTKPTALTAERVGRSYAAGQFDLFENGGCFIEVVGDAR